MKKYLHRIFSFIIVVTVIVGMQMSAINTLHASILNTDLHSSEAELAEMYATVEKYTTIWERDSVTGKYSYPITPDSKIWNELNHGEREALSIIPDYVIEDISESELVELVLDYPLLIDVYAYSSFEEGLKVVSEYFPAFERMLTDQLIDSYVGISNQNDVYTTQLNVSLPVRKDLKEKFIQDYFQGTSTFEDSSSMNSYLYSLVNTPNGTPVSYSIYGEQLDDDDKNYYADYVATQYPNCTLISEATTNYNCHSYAWHISNANNMVWVHDATPYITDGSASYVGLNPTANNQRVYYDYSGNEHSGIVINYSTKLIKSKWGSLPLMTHNVYDCPYFHIPMATTGIKYYNY